jgi:hypothetical protein
MKLLPTSILAAPAVLVFATTWLHGCSSETVTLLDVKVGDGGQPSGPRVCATADDCSNGFFCDLPTCSAASGTCQPYPVGSCPDAGPDDSNEALECGCDKITYWNSCVRSRFGVSKAYDGACVPDPSQPPCVLDAGACPTGTLCAQLGPSGHGPQSDPCAHPPLSSCWALPPRCPSMDPSSSVFLWTSCENGATCIDTCNAIAQGGAYRGAGTHECGE